MRLPHISNRSSERERVMLRQWKLLLAGLLLGWPSGLAAWGVGAAIVIGFGLYDVSATTPHDPLFGWLVHRTMIRSVKVRATEVVPHSFTQPELTCGSQLYQWHCAACHGGPGISRQVGSMGSRQRRPIYSMRRGNGRRRSCISSLQIA